MGELVKSNIEFRNYIDDNSYRIFNTLTFRCLGVWWAFDFFTRNLTISKVKEPVSPYERNRSSFGIEHFRDNDRAVSESILNAPDEVYEHILSDLGIDSVFEAKKVRFPEEYFYEDYQEFLSTYKKKNFTSKGFEVSVSFADFNNPVEFVEKWKDYKFLSLKDSQIYQTVREHSSFYFPIVKRGADFFIHLNRDHISNYEWDEIKKDEHYSEYISFLNSKKDVLKELYENFDLDRFVDEIEPLENRVAQKTYLLHQLNPVEFPFFDAHCGRFLNFITTGKVEPMYFSHKTYFTYYLERYRPWYLRTQKKYNLKVEEFNSALHRYGKFLGTLLDYPVDFKVKMHE